MGGQIRLCGGKLLTKKGTDTDCSFAPRRDLNTSCRFRHAPSCRDDSRSTCAIQTGRRLTSRAVRSSRGLRRAGQRRLGTCCRNDVGRLRVGFGASLMCKGDCGRRRTGRRDRARNGHSVDSFGRTSGHLCTTGLVLARPL